MSSKPTRKLNSLPFSGWVIKQINSFLNSTNFSRQIKILIELNPYLIADTYNYRNKEFEITTKKSFLILWIYLLKNVDTIPYTKRTLYYNIIVSLIKRYEFDLINCSCEFLKSDDTKDCKDGDTIHEADCDLDILIEYYNNLIKTQEYVFQVLTLPVVLKIQKQFCLQVSQSIFYFLF